MPIAEPLPETRSRHTPDGGMQPNIDLKLLRTFVKIYECGSMSRAAEHLFCSPAAISMRLKTIEDEIGANLFVRHHHRLDPTDLGEQMYWKANALLRSFDDLLERAQGHTRRRTIRIGVPDDYALSFVQRGLRKLDFAQSDIAIDIICNLSTHLDVAIQRKEIDIGLATLEYLPPNGKLLSTSCLNWVGDPEIRPPLEGTVPLAAYPEGCVFRRAMIEALEATNTPWRIASQSKTSSGILAAVRSGLAITVMAEGSVPPDLVVIKDQSLPPLRRVPIYLLTSATSNEEVKLIEDAIIEQICV